MIIKKADMGNLGKNDLENEIKKYDLATPLPSILDFDRIFEETERKFSSEFDRLQEEEPELVERL
ncbi:MAG: hypothetical protein NY202_03975 [Mollicutes bacterium UO1]